MSLRGLLICVVIIFCKGTDSEVAVNPSNNIIVAAGTPVTITCNVNPHSDAGWRVLLWNSTELKYFSASLSQSIPVGLNISRPISEVIKLQFLGTNQIVTAAQCQFIGLNGNPVRSHIVNITIVDPPTAPTDAMALLNGNTLTVHWKPPSIISAGSLNYTVTLTAPKIQSVTVYDFSYNFTIDEDSCTPYYNVTITATNIAGENSTTIQGYIPIIRDIYHEVFRQNNFIYFNATILVPHCINFNTTKFQLLVFEDDDDKSASNVSTSSNCTPISISDTCISCRAKLQSNSSFIFVIKHLDMTLSEPIKFNTNELQIAGVSKQVSVQTYSVTCVFLTGSEVRGCRFILVGKGNTANISGDIIRYSGNSASAFVNITRIGEYSSIMASLFNDTCESCSYKSFPLHLKEASMPSKVCMEIMETTVTYTSKITTASLINHSNQHLIIICSTIGSAILMFLVLVKVIVIYCYIQHRTMIGNKKFSTSIQDSSKSTYDTTNHIINSNMRNHHTGTDNESHLYSTINDRETAIYHVLEREDKREWNVQENEIYSEIKLTSSAANKTLSVASNVS